MKKLLLLLSILFWCSTTLAQSKKINISWKAVSTTNSISAASSPTNKGAKVNTKNEAFTSTSEAALEALKLSLSKDEISYGDQWEDTGYVNPASLTISNVRYSTLTSKELALINTEMVPTDLNATIISKKGRDQIYTQLSISPVVRSNGQIRKILSFNAAYTYFPNNRTGAVRIPLTNSVLASGEWFKFRIEKTGIHVISRSFLEDLGMNVSNIDPRTIKIYGHGGKPLPLLNSKNNDLFDLPQTSIQVIGEADGSFDSSDQILFYGVSVLGYDEENDTNLNPYSDESYYYITHGGNQGLRVQQMAEPATSQVSITTFNDSQFQEEDDFSPAKVGRRWFGNRFDIEEDQTYEFTFPNIVPGSFVDVDLNVGSSSEAVTSMAVSINGSALNPISFGSIQGTTLLSFRGGVDQEYSIPSSGETVTVNLLYNNGNNPSSIGYLDFVRVSALRQLIASQEQFGFRYNQALNDSRVGEFIISNAAAVSQVWDVTNPRAIKAKRNETATGTFSFKAQLGEIREYVAVVPSNYFSPIEIGVSRIVNQNIKGTIFQGENGNFQDLDYLIITAPFLLQPALRLADYHKRMRGLNVKVVTTDKIYEEFSSGKQDIGAIRNLVRYVYENASSPASRVKYVGIFGDTSVDYKDRLPNNNNTVPTFHTLSSVSTFASYMSDDFYGMMDADPSNGNDEGLMEPSDKLDIAFGRILADNVGLANEMVDKIINYESNDSYGNWRNNIIMISDDVDEDFEYEDLQIALDDLADQITAEKPFVNVEKIHMDAYQQQTSAGGNRYPEVNAIVKNDIEVGALIVNYFGHGGEDGLAKEFIYTKETARSLRNPNRLPMIVTVTCEFTKFDLPSRVTAGELTFWNKEGGAISLITTTRSISVTVGSQLNILLADEIFGFGQDVPDVPAIGLRKAKNSVPNNNSNRRVVFYIGDPALPLAFPKKDIKLTSINGAPVTSSSDVLQGLGLVTLGGQVLNPNGTVAANYNGVLEAKVFDKNVERETLGNDGVIIDGELGIITFTTLGEVLFSGQATVTNGQFEFDFIIPRDVQIPVGNGKVSFYSKQNNTLLDNNGFNLDIRVGGLNPNAGEDTTGPLVQLFMNDESFVSGGVTNDSPNLIIKMEDASGINTASGIGHDLIAVLDGDEENPFKLNDYYQANVDDFTRGTASYRLRDLEDGLHTVSVRAWDTYNNSSTTEIDFLVSGGDGLEITRVLNYPNPFVDYTEFWFNHNRPFEPLEVQIQVFTVTGKVVWTKNQIVNTDGFLSREITWNGLDDFGQKIGKGVYVYKITVNSTLTNQRTEKFEKLVIL
jgi:hypothetical protein